MIYPAYFVCGGDSSKVIFPDFKDLEVTFNCFSEMQAAVNKAVDDLHEPGELDVCAPTSFDNLPSTGVYTGGSWIFIDLDMKWCFKWRQQGLESRDA